MNHAIYCIFRLLASQILINSAPIHLSCLLDSVFSTLHKIAAQARNDKALQNIQWATNPAPALIQHMRVNHGGGYIRMPQ